jgi:hypothetical protein
MGGRAVAEVEVAAFAADLRGARTEQLDDVRLGAPQRRRLHTRRGADMRADHLEEATDETARRPVRERNAATGAQHAQHLAGGALVVGGEHDAEGGQHDVEARVAERQRFGIGELKVHRQLFGQRARATFVEQALHVVGGGDHRVAACGGQRGIAVAGRHVEHGLAGAHIGRFG